jgi:hypothetical protein
VPIFLLVARQRLLLVLLLIMILVDIPSFELVFLFSFFAENFRVISLSADQMGLFNLGNSFACHFILVFNSFDYYFD